MNSAGFQIETNEIVIDSTWLPGLPSVKVTRTLSNKPTEIFGPWLKDFWSPRCLYLSRWTGFRLIWHQRNPFPFDLLSPYIWSKVFCSTFPHCRLTGVKLKSRNHAQAWRKEIIVHWNTDSFGRCKMHSLKSVSLVICHILVQREFEEPAIGWWGKFAF